MNKLISFLIFIGMGVYIIFNPKITSSGGTIDLSYMNINIFLGFVLISFGILIVNSKKNSQKDSSSDGGNSLVIGDTPSMEPSAVDCSIGDGC